MANENELIVIFGADGKPLEKTLADLEADLKNFQGQLKNVGTATAIGDLNKKLIETKANIAAIKGFQLDKQLSAIKPGANQAGAALTDLSRIAQDAPFGFIAIQNNINPLIESFGRLKESTGSTGAAFKALAGSLAGPGGIGLAIGLVTAAFTLYTQLSRGAQAETKKLKDETEGVANAIATEAARVSILVSVLQNETTTRKQRNQAIEELKRINPNYFGQLKDEENLISNLTGVYNAYVQGLVNAARSKAFEKKLQSAFEKKIDLELSVDPDKPSNVIAITRSLGDQAKQAFMKAYNITPSDAIDLNKGLTMDSAGVWTKYGAFAGKDFNKGFIQAGSFFDGKQVTGEIDKVNRDIDFFIKKIQEGGQVKLDPFKEANANKEKIGLNFDQLFIGIEEDMGKQWQKLIDFSDSEADRYFEDLGKQFTNGERLRKLRQQMNGQSELQRLGITDVQPSANTAIPYTIDIQAIDRQGQILRDFKLLAATPPDVSWLTDIGAQNMILLESLNSIGQRLQVVGSLVNEFFAPAFQNFFSSLISGTQSAGQAVGAFLKNLVKQLVVTIATAAALAAIMSAFGLGGAGGFSGLFKGFLGIRGGGLGAGPSSGALNGAGSGFGGDFNLRLDGNDLVASLARTNGSNGRLGG